MDHKTSYAGMSAEDENRRPGRHESGNGRGSDRTGDECVVAFIGHNGTPVNYRGVAELIRLIMPI